MIRSSQAHSLTILLLFSTACGLSRPTGTLDRSKDSLPESPPAPGPTTGEASDATATSAPFDGGGVGGGNGDITAGTLTAGAWDDNLNFESFLSFRSSMGQQSGLLPLDEVAHRAAHDLAAQATGAKATLDVALLIDTTGSMGDELEYLKTEFLALADTVRGRYPNAGQRWGLVLYRDDGDDYVTKPIDFLSDAQAFHGALSAQSAGGGGDFPEAPERGLAASNALSWRSDPTTARVVFWIADAPHHTQDAQEMAEAIKAAAQKGIHVYPVASSGIDDFTELLMRSAAQLTRGRYLFLTDDSGVGGEHKEPRIPCYYVTKLDAAITRMIEIEMTGTYREPTATEIIRASGEPTEGTCTLDSGNQVQAF